MAQHWSVRATEKANIFQKIKEPPLKHNFLHITPNHTLRSVENVDEVFCIHNIHIWMYEFTQMFNIQEVHFDYSRFSVILQNVCTFRLRSWWKCLLRLPFKMCFFFLHLYWNWIYQWSLKIHGTMAMVLMMIRANVHTTNGTLLFCFSFFFFFNFID